MSVTAGRIPAEPWAPAQVTLVAAGNVAGIVTVLLSWQRASGLGRGGAQTGWVTVAVAGAVVVAATNAMWLLAARRSVARRIGGVVEETAPRLRAPGGREIDVDAAERLLPVATDSMRWYHRPDCPLTAGKRVTAATVETHTGAGRAACGVCAP